MIKLFEVTGYHAHGYVANVVEATSLEQALKKLKPSLRKLTKNHISRWQVTLYGEFPA